MIKFVVYLPNKGYVHFEAARESYIVDDPVDATLYTSFEWAQKRLKRNAPIYIGTQQYNNKDFEIFEIEFRYKILMKVL